MPKRPRNLRKRNGTYHVRYQIDGKPYERTLGTGNQAEAARLARELIEEHRYGRAPRRRSVSVAEFAVRWIDEACSLSRKGKGVRLAEQRLRDHILPHVGHLPIDVVTVSDVRQLRARLDETHLRPQTVRHVLSDLRALFRYAEKLGEIGKSPVDPGVLPKVPETAPKALTDHEVESIIRHARDHRPTVVLLLETGLRWGEAHRLQWRHVLWESRELLIEEQKNGKAQYVPLSDAALGALRELLATTNSVFVTPERSKNAQGWVKGIRRRCGFTWSAHQLRHTCGTRLIRRTGNREAVRQMLRHSSHRMTDRYATTSREWLREIVTGTKSGHSESGLA